MQNLIKTYPLVEFLQHYRYDNECNTLKQGINDLCDRIGEAQKKVQERLDKEKYPIWELTPVIAGLFANNEFYTEERQEYICDWVSEQERIDELVDVFKNAIPVALSILAFFMPAGIALIVQIINTAAGAAATIEDIQQATNTKELVYSQYNVSYEAEKVLTEANLSQAEFNLAMAVFSGVFVVADFADTIRLAKKLGIGDQVMRLFAKGTATKEEIHELVELTVKNQRKLKAGTPEHKAARWNEYQSRGGKWDYKRWSNQYDVNMKNASYGIEREVRYREVIGGTSSIRKTPYTMRQIDILKENEMYMGQLKTGKISLTEQVKLDLQKDRYFVQKGFTVEYFLEQGASKPVLDLMDKYEINYIIGKSIQ